MNERELFTEALRHPNAVERAAYLNEACGADVALRQRVERLLALHESDHAILDRRPAELLEAMSEKPLTTRIGDADAGTAEPTAAAIAQQLAVLLAVSARPDALGRLGHYEVLEVLGQGGFGIVVKAFDTRLSRMVAIKVLAPHLAATSPPRKRFIYEARVAARVRHEHVVQIYAVEQQPLPYLVMEFIDGQTLQQRLDATGPLEAAEVVRLGQQIAQGLAAAHDKGLIHRDVKPANILLEAGVEPRVKLTDFGLARAADDASLTQSGVIAGTPMYMAPEQAQGEELDHRADLFSLGSVLYTMTTGHPPFRAHNTLAVLKRVSEDKPRPIRELVVETPPGLCAVISRLLEKKSANRFASAKEVAEVLSHCLTDPVPRMPGARLKALAKGACFAGALLLLTGACWIVWAGLTNQNQDDRIENIADVKPAGDKLIPKELEPTATMDTWAKAIPRMDAEDQVAVVLARLKKLNPKFNEKSVSHGTEKGVVIALDVGNCDHLKDLTPLRALVGLRKLQLRGRGPSDIGPLKGLKLTIFETNASPIKDLSPLAGMPLKALNLWLFSTADLSPLRGMKLVHANFGGSPVKDISVLRGMPIEGLCLNHSQVEDLSPLVGMPLLALECENTKVTNITPLAKLPLEKLWLTGSPIADYSPLQHMPLKQVSFSNYQPKLHAKLLRSIATLQTVNKTPVAQFLGDDK